MAHRVPISVDDSQDPLARMRVAQLADELRPDCYKDAKLILADPITNHLAGQLYDAVCSIDAQIAEAYSRSSVRIERCGLNMLSAQFARA